MPRDGEDERRSDPVGGTFFEKFLLVIVGAIVGAIALIVFVASESAVFYEYIVEDINRVTKYVIAVVFIGAIMGVLWMFDRPKD
jgi:hypothetical protein